jgi:phenylacetate-coenzyme A ligase PaaK-like adenylate-forming protein
MWPSAVFSACAFAGLRLAGLPYPLPEHVPLSEGHRVASWVAAKVAAGTPPCLDQPSSNAVRIATAALERGWDISGSRFRFGGEPMTRAKYARIREAGCEVVAGWALSEAGPLAGGCVQREAVDEVHLFEGKIAVIQRPVSTSAGVEHADVLHLTTLLPATPKILLNVDTGDTATISLRDCGCPLHRPSMRTRVHTIRNYEKLTTSGMHFTASEILNLVETVLPAKFGGDPTDYQFVEEHAQELSTVAIWIHPRLGPLEDETVVETALRALGADSRGNSMMASNWRQGHSLRVVRREPYVTPAAKTPPIRVISREDA